MFKEFFGGKKLLAKETKEMPSDIDPGGTVKVGMDENGGVRDVYESKDVVGVRSYDLMDDDNLVIETEDGVIYHFSIKKDLKAGVGSIACIVGPENLKGKEWTLPTNVAMIGAASIGDAPIGKVKSIKIMRLKSRENRRTSGENS